MPGSGTSNSRSPAELRTGSTSPPPPTATSLHPATTCSSSSTPAASPPSPGSSTCRKSGNLYDGTTEHRPPMMAARGAPLAEHRLIRLVTVHLEADDHAGVIG